MHLIVNDTPAATWDQGSRKSASWSLFVGLLFLAQVSAVSAEGGTEVAAPDFSNSTHHELTELGARWDELSDLERRLLLREVKLRMAQRKDSDGVLMIRTQRRYGRIYRNSDGRVLRIETQVVQVRPLEGAGQRTGFGVGFERRSADEPGTPDPADDDSSPPAVLVNDSTRH
jgi:hypothetical protein